MANEYWNSTKLWNTDYYWASSQINTGSWHTTGIKVAKPEMRVLWEQTRNLVNKITTACVRDSWVHLMNSSQKWVHQGDQPYNGEKHS
jgi:hypothetical protein